METVFSPDRKYRYTLWRQWGDDPTFFVNFIGLNPSTADETKDDPTIRKCRGFARQWGYDAMCMTNLFAFRATDPRQLKLAGSPIGLGNDHYLLKAAREARLIVAAWGNHGRLMNQDFRVGAALLGAASLKCFKQNKDGSPAHPLYIPYDTPLIEYKAR